MQRMVCKAYKYCVDNIGLFGEQTGDRCSPLPPFVRLMHKASERCLYFLHKKAVAGNARHGKLSKLFLWRVFTAETKKSRPSKERRDMGAGARPAKYSRLKKLLSGVKIKADKNAVADRARHGEWLELLTGLEPVTSSLPRTCSTYWAIAAYQLQ